MDIQSPFNAQSMFRKDNSDEPIAYDRSKLLGERAEVSSVVLDQENVDVKVSSMEDDKDKNETETVLDNAFQLDEAVKKVSDFLSAQNRDLLFNVDEQTQRTVVTVKDSSSGEVIRQIPSEEILKLADRIQELQQDVGNSIGIFINSEI
ncbi:Flagellar biosynthesis protein FlaG [Alteromonas macleodii]|uniref:flagellar protein FlaG n=1 Tax=Alteromonas macleodii TaxID=28108 RepID=UPI00313C9885